MHRSFENKLKRLRPGFVIAVFLVLVSPNLLAPFHADDYFQQLLLRGDAMLERGDDGSLRGLFSFIEKDGSSRQQMQNYGVLPWFAAEDFYFRFWRPVAELSHILDHWLLPGNAAWAHAHNILWFLLLAAVVILLVRQTLPQDKLLLCLVLAVFLWNGQHVATIHWIANRNALIAAVLAFTALSCHIRWRQSGQWLWLPLALLVFLSGLLASESATALGVYLLAYALVLDNGRRWHNLLAIVPYALLALGWLYVYQSLGFGAGAAGGLYINPLYQPLEYAQALLQRLPVYFAAALLPMPAGISWAGGIAMPWLQVLVAGFSMVFMVVVLYSYRALLLGNRALLFWFVAAVFAVLPVCTSLAQDRLALMQTVGMDIAIACVIYSLLLRQPAVMSLQLPLKQYLLSVLVVIHLLLAPLHLLAGSLYMSWATHEIKNRALTFADNGSLQGRQLLVLSMPIGEATSLLGIRRFYHYDIPDSFLWLASDETALEVTKRDDKTLLIEKRAGFGSGFESAFGDMSGRMQQGQLLAVATGKISIEALNSKAYPSHIMLHLHSPLSDNKLLMYSYDAPSASLKPVDW